MRKAKVGPPKIRAFLTQEDGTIAIISAVAMVAMIGTAGLALEYGNALLTKTTAQRAIDLAVYSAAVEYTQSGDETRMDATAASVLRINGVDPATLDLVLADDTLRGTVSTTAPLGLTRVLRDDSSVDIGVSATALLGPGEPNCVVALDSDGVGIALSGNSSIAAPNCAVASGSSIEANGNAYEITTPRLTYGPGGTLDLKNPDDNVRTSDGTPAPIEQETPEDPLNPSAARDEASRLLGLARNNAAGGPDITFSEYKKKDDPDEIPNRVAMIPGCTADDNDTDGKSWTVSCSGESEYAFGRITVDKKVSLEFETPGNYLIDGGIAIDKQADAVFRGGTYLIGGSIESGGSLGLNGGAYAVTDYVNIGGSLDAESATFLIGGDKQGPTKCDMSSLCIAGGTTRAKFTAPSSGTFADIAVMGPFNSPYANAEIATGNVGLDVSGAFYFPEGRLSIGGNSTMASDSGECLELIARKIVLTGTPSISTGSCQADTSTDNTEVRLIR